VLPNIPRRLLVRLTSDEAAAAILKEAPKLRAVISESVAMSPATLTSIPTCRPMLPNWHMRLGNCVVNPDSNNQRAGVVFVRIVQRSLMQCQLTG